MKNFTYLLITFITILSSNSLFAQNLSCGSHTHHLNLLQNDPQYVINRQAIENQTAAYTASAQPKKRFVKTIPVVVHVLYNTVSQNVSDAQIASQIQVLNEDFRKLNADVSNAPAAFSGLAADCEINFCLAQRDPNGNASTGIERKYTTNTNWTQNDAMKYNMYGGLDAWDRNSYLNIWVVKINGLLGYSQFPGGSPLTDGVVINYRAFGTMGSAIAPYNKGRVATHEVGHWLNLFHIWGDDGGSCAGTDLVNDTPNQAGENYGCPTFPLVSCSGAPDGDMFMNYMDYTNDACKNMFTAGQKVRIDALFTPSGARYALLNSLGCVPVFTCSIPSGIGASTVTTNSAIISWGSVTGATSYTLEYKEATASGWNAITTTTPSFSLVGLNANTNYEFHVSTTCNSGVSPFSATSTFSTLAPPPPCTEPTAITASNITSTDATIAWTGIANAASYTLEYKLSSNTTWTSLNTLATSYTLTTLNSSSAYEFRLMTNCSNGTSPYTATYTFTTLFAALPCSSTSYENNNTKLTAFAIPSNTSIISQVQLLGDVDWYAVTTTNAQPKIKINLTNLPADYDVALYTLNSNTKLGISQNSQLANEEIVFNNYSVGGTYYIKVYGYSGANNSSSCYTLTTTTSANNLRLDNTASDNTKIQLDLTPNPCSTNASVTYYAQQDDEVIATLYNCLGQKMTTQNKTAVAGANIIDFNVANYPAGMYMFELMLNGERTTQKFIVSK